MATLSIHLCKCCISLLLLSCLCLSDAGLQFEVGDRNGWDVPPSNDTEFYNKWASENRFRVGDTIRFKYAKDSVIVVTGSDYDRCNPAHPVLYFNDGNTVFQFDRSGDFYFISGVVGHCEQGQKMITRVLSQSTGPTPVSTQGGQTGATNTPATPNAAVPMMAMATPTIFTVFFSLFLSFI